MEWKRKKTCIFVGKVVSINLINQDFFKMEKKHGGKRDGSGRKPKIEEDSLIDKMDNVMSLELVLDKLAETINGKETNAIKTWLSYRLGMPKQIIESKSEVIVDTPIELSEEQFKEALEMIKPK